MRLFIGVWLSPELREEVAGVIGQLSQGSTGWKWTSPENLHFTLRFLGEVPLGRIAQLKEQLQKIAVTSRPYVLSLGQPGVFPPRGVPRILWIGAASGGEELIGLAGRVEQICRDCGFPAEVKPFKPHLTLARAKSDNPRLESRPWQSLLNTTLVDGFSLIESELAPAGSVYHSVADFKFGR